MVSIEISSNTRLSGRVFVDEPIRIFANCSVNDATIGAFSYIAPGCLLHRVKIGRYCSVGDGTQILSAHPVHGLTTSPFPYQTLFRPPFDAPPRIPFENLAETIIGHDVWIGSGAKLKSGVKIGNGAIIGAGSVVTKDIAPYSIVGGAPARFIRQRFGEATVERLLALSWWQYDLVSRPLAWDDLEATLDDLTRGIDSGEITPYTPRRYAIFRDGADIRAKRLDT